MQSSDNRRNAANEKRVLNEERAPEHDAERAERTGEAPALNKLAKQVTGAIDHWVTSLLQDPEESKRPTHGAVQLWGNEMKQHTGRSNRSRMLSAEDEVRTLLTTATHLDDLWSFFLHRLQTGSNTDLILFSVVDESQEFLRVRFVYPEPDMADAMAALDLPAIPTKNNQSHLVQAFQMKDTTFCMHSHQLGGELQGFIPKADNLFTIPFLAAGQVTALLTIGFKEVDTFSQAKLSYLYTIRDQIAQLVWNLILNDRIHQQALTDGLTGLLTHSHFQHVYDLEMRKAQQNGTPLTALILDIDQMQHYNANGGHAKGDSIIRFTAATLKRLVRGIDTVARFGGDEMVVLLPETDHKTADIIAERFVKSFEEAQKGQAETIQVSLGYATYPHDTTDRDDLLKRAEQALQLANFRTTKTGESVAIAWRKTGELNEKTVLELFASHVAKKYNAKTEDIYQGLIKRVESRVEQATLSTKENLMLETIGSLANALEAKDPYTRGHSQAVANYAAALAHSLQLSPKEIEAIRLAGLLHDIGKIGIPESILNKAGKLTPEEWDMMRQHPSIGAQQILMPVSSLSHIIEYVEHHHEAWDGSGYPKGLAGEEIPLPARIISVVDAFHAMTSERSYRKAMPVEQAKEILQQGAGKQWDPHLVKVFIRILTMASPKFTQQMDPQAYYKQRAVEASRETQTHEALQQTEAGQAEAKSQPEPSLTY